MALARETEMTAAELDAFLGSHETGVLSLAKADEPYSVPVSYGYDADGRAFYVRLVSTEGSEKRRFLADEPTARMVVYDSEHEEDGETYRSAIAVGPLTEIDPATLSVEQIEQYGEARRPLFEIWGESRAELDIRLFALEPTELTGRRTEVERE